MAQLSNPTYTFPNVSFTETLIQPTSVASSYRNTIGVAGVFARGPATPTRIKSRRDFADIFGEDNSDGSILVRQAMQQGATEFIISRVVPGDKPSSGAVSLQPGAGATTLQPFVASSGPRTTGLTFTASFIDSPRISFGNLLGASATTDAAQQINIPGFNGSGYFDFQVVEKVTPPTSATTSTSMSFASVAVSTAAQYQTVTVSSTADIKTLQTSAKPGYTLNLGSNTLNIASYPYQTSTGYSVLVKGVATAGTNVSGTIASPTGNPYFVLGYAYRAGDSLSLPGNVAPAINSTTGVTYQGFLLLDNQSAVYQDITLLNTTVAPSVYTSVPTGVKLSIGNTSAVSALTPTELIVGTVFSINFASATVSIGEINSAAVGFPNTANAFTKGQSGLSILSELADALTNNVTLSNLFTEDVINQTQLPYSLTFNSNFSGLGANRVFYKLQATIGDDSPATTPPTPLPTVPTDLLFGALGNLYNTNIQMTGGQDGVQSAGLTLYDVAGNPLVYISALSPGLEGNRIRVSITPLPPGKFRLQVFDDASQFYNVALAPESYVLSNYTTDVLSGAYVELANSKLISATFIPAIYANNSAVPKTAYDATPQRVAPPIPSLASSTNLANAYHPNHTGSFYLSNLNLRGGYEASNFKLTDPAESDYIEAIQALASQDCAIIACAGITAGDIRYSNAVSELQSQAESSTTFSGLRVAVVAAPKGLSKSGAANVSAGLNSERLVVVSGWVTNASINNKGANNVPPDGIYIGYLALTSPYVSPASTLGNNPVGIVTVDSKSDPSYLEAFTEAGVEVLFFDSGLKVYKFLNGRNTSNTYQTNLICLRRQDDQMITDLNSNLIWVRSRPNSTTLQSQTATAVDAYLKTQYRAGAISGFSPTVCDSSNNTQARVLNVTYTYTPIYPADYIRVASVKDVSNDISIPVQ